MTAYETIADEDFADAIRYINGDNDDAAEDAYYAIEPIALSNVKTGLRILERLAAGVDDRALGYLGAGMFESFLRTCGAEDPDMIEEAITGNARLLRALRGVRSLAVPFDLAVRLGSLLE